MVPVSSLPGASVTVVCGLQRENGHSTLVVRGRLKERAEADGPKQWYGAVVTPLDRGTTVAEASFSLKAKVTGKAPPRVYPKYPGPMDQWFGQESKLLGTCKSRAGILGIESAGRPAPCKQRCLCHTQVWVGK
eukprot:SAG31_NODE_18935_length_617_cov_1.256757_1_plen_132_part_10